MVKDEIKPYNVKDHKIKARQRLMQAGYMEKEIEPWIDAIDE